MGVYGKLAELVSRVHYVQKSGANTHHKYSYLTEGDLLDAVRPVMAELGLVFYPHRADVIATSSTSTLITIKYVYRLVDSESGENIDIEVIAQGSDSQDKASYKAATGARKYALRQLVLAATGDDPEEDDDSNERGVLNTNAIPVIRKLVSGGFFTHPEIERDSNYAVLEKAIGVGLKKFPNTDKGTSALRHVFAMAAAYAKDPSKESELIRICADNVNQELYGKSAT
jgi:ERF superfamily